MKNEGFFGNQSIDIDEGGVEVFYYLAVFGDRKSFFDCVTELFFKLYGYDSFIIPKKIINSNLCVMGGGRGGDDDIGDIVSNCGIDSGLEKVVEFALFIIIGAG